MNSLITDAVDLKGDSALNLLLEARDRLGLSSRDIAKSLNISSVLIADLESGYFHRLHGEVFVVSYLRAYAELVGLDANHVVACYRANKQAQQQAQQQQVETKPELSKPSVFASLSMRSQHKRHRTGLGLMAALIVALCGVLLLPQSGNSVASQIDQLSMEHIVIDTPQGTTAINDIALIAGDNPTEALLPQIETPVSRITSQQTTEPALSRLSFQFTEDCWVEVYDGNNERIFASLKKSDDLLELEGKPPFKVTLGYAPGVSLSYNGQPIEIGTTDSRRHLTKLVLGNS